MGFFPVSFVYIINQLSEVIFNWLRTSHYFHLFSSSLPLIWQGVFISAFLPTLSYIIYYILFVVLFKTSLFWNTFKLKASCKTEGGGGQGSGIEGQPLLHGESEASLTYLRCRFKKMQKNKPTLSYPVSLPTS